MATSTNGFTGGFSGRLGNVIGYEWRGKMCVRSMPSHYRDAQTPRQLAHRALFKATVGFATKARHIIDKGLHQVSLNAQMTEVNYFMRINKRCLSLAEAATAEAQNAPQPTPTATLDVDYEHLVLADGPVAPVAFHTPVMTDDTTIRVAFDKNPLHRAVKQGDCVYLAAYCPEVGDFDISAACYRNSGFAEIRLHPYWAGKEIHLWGFVVDTAGRASLSQHLAHAPLSPTAWPPEEEEEPIEDLTDSVDYEHNSPTNTQSTGVFVRGWKTASSDRNGVP